MTSRFTWISSAATPAMRNATFGGDMSLEAKSLAQAVALAKEVRAADRFACSPDLAARETAAALGLSAKPDPQLAELDYGRWSGQPLAAIEAADPAGLIAWLSDPAASPHGGETIQALLARIAQWLETERQQPGHVMVIAPANCVRAAILHCLQMPAATFRRLDIMPLSFTQLSVQAGQWRLRSSGCRFPGFASEA